MHHLTNIVTLGFSLHVFLLSKGFSIVRAAQYLKKTWFYFAIFGYLQSQSLTSLWTNFCWLKMGLNQNDTKTQEGLKLKHFYT